MKWMKNIPFLGKLVILCMIPMILLGSVIGIMSGSYANDVVKQSQKQVLKDVVNRIDINVNVKAQQISRCLDVFAECVQMNVSLAEEVMDVNDVSEIQDSLWEMCQNMTDTITEIDSVMFLTDEGLVYTSEEANREIDEEKLGLLFELAKEKKGQVYWSDVSVASTYTENPVIVVYKGIFSDEGEMLGVIVLGISREQLGSAILTKQRIMNYQMTMLVDRSGTVIYSDSVIKKDLLDAAEERYSQGRRSYQVKLGNETYHVCARYNALTNWVTYTMIEEENLFPGFSDLQNYIILLVSAAMGVAFIFLLILSSAIVKPLARLEKGMREVIDKDFELQLENDRKDEIGKLTDSFNYMVARINTLVKQNYERSIEQKNAEIKALQTQMNPHFLYNTLDSINWMLIERGEMDISKVVVALGKLMQYTMDTTTSMVSLQEEYHNAQNYLMVQKNRLEERLEFFIELEEGLESFLVPKLIIQPLIENCIKHDIELNNKKGTIWVQSHKEKDRVCILVKDNGIGMNAEQLAHYKELLSSDGGSYSNIGVHNMVRRLQLQFNGQCEFVVESSPGKGVCLRIFIPVNLEVQDNVYSCD